MFHVVSLLLAAAAPHSAQDAAAAGATAARQGSTPAAVQITDLVWLAGSWEGELFGQPAEEHWSEPRGRSIVGMFRLGAESSRPMYELILIEQESDGVKMRLRHYGPGFTDLDAAPLVLSLVDAGEKWAEFSTGQEPVPDARVRYERVSATELAVRLELKRGEATRTAEARWRLKGSSPADPAAADAKASDK